MSSESKKCSRPNCKNRQIRRGLCLKHAKVIPAERRTREECMAVVEALHASGMRDSEISDRAGIPRSAIAMFIAREQQVFTPKTYDRLTALIGQESRYAPVWTVARRLQALLAIGITLSEISAATGIERTLLNTYLLGGDDRWKRQEPRLSRDVAKKIYDIYDQWSGLPKKTPAAKIMVRNYAPPAAWSEIDVHSARPFRPGKRSHLYFYEFSDQDRTQARIVLRQCGAERLKEILQWECDNKLLYKRLHLGYPISGAARAELQKVFEGLGCVE